MTVRLNARRPEWRLIANHESNTLCLRHVLLHSLACFLADAPRTRSYSGVYIIFVERTNSAVLWAGRTIRETKRTKARFCGVMTTINRKDARRQHLLCRGAVDVYPRFARSSACNTFNAPPPSSSRFTKRLLTPRNFINLCNPPQKRLEQNAHAAQLPNCCRYFSFAKSLPAT